MSNGTVRDADVYISRSSLN